MAEEYKAERKKLDEEKKKPVAAEGQQTGTEQEQAPAVQAQETPTAPPPVLTNTFAGGTSGVYGDYQRQAEKRYATTLADIRQRRKELDAKYQPDIDRQKRVMKIIALGKLIGQLGQLGGAAIGGAAGTPVVDKDPYQINAWKELNRLQEEQKYYGKQLDAEELAARKSMQAGLDKLAVEEIRAQRNADAIVQRYNMQLKVKEYDANVKMKIAELNHDFKVAYKKAEREEQRETLKLKYGLEFEKILKQGEKEKDVASTKHGYTSEEIAQRGEEARKTKGTPTAVESYALNKATGGNGGGTSSGQSAQPSGTASTSQVQPKAASSNGKKSVSGFGKKKKSVKGFQGK